MTAMRCNRMSTALAVMEDRDEAVAVRGKGTESKDTRMVCCSDGCTVTKFLAEVVGSQV